MRKQAAKVITLMIIAVFCVAGTGTAEVNAQTAQTGIGGMTNQYPGGVTLRSASDDRAAKASIGKKSQSRYMEHAALVMFKSPKKVTKKKAKNALRSGSAGISDIEIESMWDFEAEPEQTASGGGTVKAPAKGESAAKGDSSTRAYSSVALVKSKKLSTRQIIAKMRDREDVLYAEPNYLVHAYRVNDPYFRYQWSMQGGAKGTKAYNYRTPNVTSVWSKGTTGSNRVVAILDTGVDYTHPDLKKNMWHNTHYPSLKGEYGFDFIRGDEDPMDENGHGTHCAGIIGARGNNGIGIAGVNQKIRIMALRTLDEFGSAYLSHEVAAYNYISKAQDLGVPVQAINNSWGGGEYSEIFANLVNIVGKKGAITVCAAGNAGSDNDQGGDYPSNIDSPYLISVAATKNDGKLVSFTNYGKETVDMAAPGTDILSTVSYDCYNPGIYGNKQAKYSDRFNNYESGGNIGSIQDLQNNLYLDGEPYVPGAGKPQISFDVCNSGFGASGGHAAQITIKNMKAGNMVAMTIPYELTQATKQAPYFSVMTQADGTRSENAAVGIADVTAGMDLTIAALEYYPLMGIVYTEEGRADNWRHISAQTIDEDTLEEYKEQSKGQNGKGASAAAAAGEGEPAVSEEAQVAEGTVTGEEYANAGEAVVSGKPANAGGAVVGGGAVVDEESANNGGAVVGEGSAKTGGAVVGNGAANTGGQAVSEGAAPVRKPSADPLKREIVILAYAYESGDMTIRLDDMGMSKQNLDASVLGKYDIMSGTSMAAPFVTGSVALLAASRDKKFQKKGALNLVNRITAMARPADLEVMARGSFNFTKMPKERWPRINGIKVDKAGGTITITGAGLKPSTGLKVKIGPTEKELKTVSISKKNHTKNKIVIKDKNWINNVETIEITGYRGMTASKSDVYLVDGKKNFTTVKNASDTTTGEAMATDGKYIYYADSKERTIWKIDPKKPGEMEKVAKIKPKKVFGKNVRSNENATYALKFGSDLVYMKGKLYTVVEYGEADSAEAEDAGWLFSNGKQNTQKSPASHKDDEIIITFGDEVVEEAEELAIYSSKLRLVSIDLKKKGKVKNLGKLPSDLARTGDYAMAAYKNKLYFMGGYDYSKQKLTKRVKVYRPAKKKKWVNGKSLPAVRAGGKAVASGGKLIYTLGYNRPVKLTGEEEIDFRFPANLTYNGRKWSVSKVKESKRIEPFFYSTLVTRGGKLYPQVDGSVSAVKNGLIYMGLPAYNYGDTFLYNVKKDKFMDTGINHISSLEKEEIHGIAVGKKLFGFDGTNVYKVNLK